MLIGPSDMYGDMDIEDVDEFEGLEPDDDREIAPLSRFERDEFRSFDDDFEEELLQGDEDYRKDEEYPDEISDEEEETWNEEFDVEEVEL